MEPQQCWHLLALVAYSLKPVKLLGPCKRTQHCWLTTPNNVGSCWHLLGPFAWALKIQLAIKIYTRPTRKTHSSHTAMHSTHPAKETILLAQSEKHTAYNFKKHTGIHSLHPAKKKFNRTQREVHSSQF